MNDKQDVIIYSGEDGSIKLNVKLEDENIWLSQAQLVELYQSSKSNINEHIKNIFTTKELEEALVVRKFRTSGKDNKQYSMLHYNLDVIIAVGYRIKSPIVKNLKNKNPNSPA